MRILSTVMLGAFLTLSGAYAFGVSHETTRGYKDSHWPMASMLANAQIKIGTDQPAKVVVVQRDSESADGWSAPEGCERRARTCT